MDGFDSYDEDRIVSMDEQHSDDWQYSLRPRKLGEYIGQEKVKAPPLKGAATLPLS